MVQNSVDFKQNVCMKFYYLSYQDVFLLNIHAYILDNLPKCSVHYTHYVFLLSHLSLSLLRSLLFYKKDFNKGSEVLNALLIIKIVGFHSTIKFRTPTPFPRTMLNIINIDL